MSLSLRRHFGDRKIVFVIGVMADKDVDSMIGYIAPLAEVFIAVRPDYPRAMDADVLAGRLSEHKAPVLAFNDIGQGVAEAIKRAGKGGVVCALGSLYFSGSIRAAYGSANSEIKKTVI
jgi:dihydrofolate synthase/folylpolyglutamate synthase